MNIFKKKYKQSSWREGMLWAESHVSLGREVSYYRSPHPDHFTKYWVKSYDRTINNTYRFPVSSDDFICGIQDYLNHYEENKEILLGGLDR